MEILIIVIPTLLLGFFLGRYTTFRMKSYGVTRKMFLTLEKSEIDRKIDIALGLEDYELALYLKRKYDRLERKLKRIKRKEKKHESNLP